MVHIAMVSTPLNQIDQGEEKKGKYADTAIHELLKILKNSFQLDKEHFIAKIFGGAKILKMVSIDVGKNNEKAVREVLQELGIRIASCQTGGEKGYHVEFYLDNGTVICQAFGGEKKEY
jgi:chemotaxis receptor (MCP) glutamine deamidase CheD